MSDLTPVDRHAKVVEEFKRRQEICEAQTPGPWKLWGGQVVSDLKNTGNLDVTPTLIEYNAVAIAAQRTERPAELRALIEIVERHRPYKISAEPKYVHLADCLTCSSAWPCLTFASAEQAAQQEKPCERPAKRGE